jgi:hypothetical protein
MTRAPGRQVRQQTAADRCGQNAARRSHRYPVKAGCAFFGVAAGAFAPAPLSFPVVVVVAVDDVSVDAPVEVDPVVSGVVVVIVVTAVVLPVVIVETIVVVACAPNGAAPAVQAAVAAPSVTNTANAAPQAAYLL